MKEKRRMKIMQVNQRLCKVKQCQQLIYWYDIPEKAGFGFWKNADGEHKDQKHLCPFFIDKRSARRTDNKDIDDLILSKLTHLETPLLLPAEL
jgi:hypothetical protein